MRFEIKLPKGAHKDFSGIIHDMFPHTFKKGKCIIELPSDEFPIQYRNLLINIVGSPEINKKPIKRKKVEVVEDD